MEELNNGTPPETDETKQPDEQATGNPPAEKQKKSAYVVQGCNIRHNDKIYKEGSKISLTETEAARLKKYLR
jgi:hypothetical protein